MVGLFFSWNLRRLVRRPRYVVLVLAIAFITLFLRIGIGRYPGALGVVALSAMALGFAAPCVHSVSAEARYLLARSAMRTACLVAWVCFGVAVMAAAVLTFQFASSPPPMMDVWVEDAESIQLLMAGGVAPTAVDPDYPEWRKYELPGYVSLVNTLIVLSALIGLFSRLREVQAGMRFTSLRRRLLAFLVTISPLALFAVWVGLAWSGRATYVAILGYLHPTWLVGVFALGVVMSAALCWRAWTRGDVQ